jgi:hypothetical protein
MKTAQHRAQLLYTLGQAFVDTALAVSACLVIYTFIVVLFSF